MTPSAPLIFPRWINSLRVALLVGAGGAAAYVGTIITFGFSPQATDVGYQPIQPVPYSHAIHAGKLGMDCRYCHTGVEDTARALVPPTQTCMGCHTNILPDSEKLRPVKHSYQTGEPVHWVRVHDLPDYAYFNHSAHVRRGVGCVECHGRIDKMEVVYQDQPLSMSWCLDCHRDPAPRLRPLDKITDMNWRPEDPDQHAQWARNFMEENKINPSLDCSTCHR
jgi:hypothetical protein